MKLLLEQTEKSLSSRLVVKNTKGRLLISKLSLGSLLKQGPVLILKSHVLSIKNRKACFIFFLSCIPLEKKNLKMLIGRNQF